MSFSPLVPDLAGLVDAQSRLRTFLGRDVRFYAPSAMLYDPTLSTSQFDDEGIPLDPLALGSAIASAGVDVANLTVVGSAHVNVVFQPLSAMRRDEVAEDTLSWRSRLNKDLILDIADEPQAATASHFMVGTFARYPAGGVIYPEQWTPDDGELWKIVNAKTDGFAGLQRFIVFGQGTH